MKKRINPKIIISLLISLVLIIVSFIMLNKIINTLSQESFVYKIYDGVIEISNTQITKSSKLGDLKSNYKDLRKDSGFYISDENGIAFIADKDRTYAFYIKFVNLSNASILPKNTLNGECYFYGMELNSQTSIRDIRAILSNFDETQNSANYYFYNGEIGYHFSFNKDQLSAIKIAF